MRWRTSHRDHDPRQLDLLAIVALVVAIIVAYAYFADHTAQPSSQSAFIVPSQSVRW